MENNSISMEQRIMLLARFVNVAMVENHFNFEVGHCGYAVVNKFTPDEDGEYKYEKCEYINFGDDVNDQKFVEDYNDAVALVNGVLPEKDQMKPITYTYNF